MDNWCNFLFDQFINQVIVHLRKDPFFKFLFHKFDLQRRTD